MRVNSTILQGYSVIKNAPPSNIANPVVTLKGTFRDKPASFGIDEDILSKHILLVGGTGSGKSTLFYHMISQLRKKMASDDVMIIFDSKGDFFNKFFTSGDAVIGNSKQYASSSMLWNIYKEVLADGWEEKDFIINTQEICRSLFEEKVKANSSNPFFPNAARDLLSAIIVKMVRLGKGDKDFMRKWFYNDKLKKYLDGCDANELFELLKDSDDLRSVLSYIDGDGPQSQGVLSEMFSVIRDIFIGVFADRGTFSIRKFVRDKGGKVLFIEYDLSIGSILTPIYRLLFDLALKEALGRTKTQGNVYLICDEFKLLPNLQHIDDGVNFGRSLGVKVMAGVQSIEQLYEIYGQSRGKNLAAGFSTIISFKANDVTTRDYISSLYGKNIVLEQYKKMDNTFVEEKRQGATVEDWDLNSLKVGEAIVGLPFQSPFRFYFDMYH